MGIASVLLIFIYCAFNVFTCSEKADIYCQKIDDGSFGNLYKIKTCELSAKDNGKIIIHNKTTQVQVINQSNETVDGVTAIVADNQAMDYFPQGLHEDFTNLGAISVINCGLQEINQLDLKKFNNLVFLNLRNNKLQTLGENLFKFNSNLTHILLNENQISTVAVNAFVGTNNLQNLGFEHNLCFSGDAMNSHDLFMLEVKILLNCSNFLMQNYSKFSDNSSKLCNCSETYDSNSVNQEHTNLNFYLVVLNTIAVILLTIAVCYLLYKTKASTQIKNADTALQTSHQLHQTFDQNNHDSKLNSVTYVHDNCNDYTEIICKNDSNPVIINEGLYSDIGTDQELETKCIGYNDEIYAEVNKSN